MRFFLPIVLLAAAASAEVFHFVGQQGHSTVYGVRGGVTVGVQKLTGEKTALEYNGTLALQQVREGEYLAKFTQFTLGKYDKINRNINDETLANLKPEEQRIVKALHEQGGQYEREMQRPVKFFMKEGKVVRMEAEKEHQQWSLNVIRGVLTLLQNQVRKPANLAVPFIEYNYEDGITGNCKVQYEILSQPEDETVTDVFNMTKTHNYKDCQGRPVYLHLKDSHRGCAGVCDNHKPENFLGKYEEEQTDFELKPTPGCPVHQQRKDSLISVQNVAKYNVSKGLLDEARTQSTDVYRLYGSEVEVHTRLQLRLRNVQGPTVEEPKNVQTYTTLQQQLPVEEEELDIPVYALMKEHTKHQQYPQYFQKHFDAVIRELRQLQQENPKKTGQEEQSFNTPVYMIELIQAISGMNEEELKKTIPAVVRQQQPKQLSEEEHLRRQLWIELIGKAGSKTAVKIATEFIKNKTFSPSEVRRVLQDIAAFQSYPDTDMIENVLALCTKQEGLTSTGKATACVAAGKIISKACDSKIFHWTQKDEQHKQLVNGKYQSLQYNQQTEDVTTEEYQMSMGRRAIDPKLRCTPEKLQQYVERLSQALRQSTDFKQVVAYINGLSMMKKPEVLPELIGYINGTAHNMHMIREKGEDQKESVEFIRRVAILSLRNVATKYPKEVNPIVRVIFQNTTEMIHTRLAAFDIWMNTQPAQWEVEKIMQVANKDTSLELTHYVYTALKTAMQAQEPCYQLLAQRIRAAWVQIRPFDFGMKFSQLRSKSYYNTVEEFGIRGIWKVMASNTTVLPTFTEAKIEQVRGPFMNTLIGAKLLVKGGDKIWEEITGKDGLLERISHAFEGQIKTGERQHKTEQLLKDIAQGMDFKTTEETPKAVLFWKFFSGEAIIPIDAETVKELKQELLQTITKMGKEGITGHFMRVFVPTKAFHVEPSTIGFPIVHSTIHPIIVSVRYENVKMNYTNQEGRIVPETLEITGTIQPTVLSLRQNRVFVAEKEGQNTPTVKISDIKEFNVRLAFRVAYEQSERRFRINVKPQFQRLFHSGHCTEFKLEKNTIVDEEPITKAINYNKCIKSLYEPIRRDQKFGGRQFGMLLRLTGESHQPWSGLPMFGSKDVRRDGLFGAILNRLANKEMKHHALSLYLEADKQTPINEWAMIIDMDSNIEALSKKPIHEQTQKVQKVKVQYQHRRQEQLNSELEQVIRKVENLVEKLAEKIDETTVEKQMLIKIEGRYQGQPKHTIKVAMKKIYNLEKTEQQFAIAAEHQESRKAVEFFGNVSYPKIGSIFHFDPTTAAEDERMNGTLIAKIQGQKEQMYRINFQATKSEEQRKESELEWFEVRCLAEQKAGKTMTDACKKAILKDNSLDRMEMTVQLPTNIHPKMEQLAKKALAIIKYKFYPQMQSEISGRRQELKGEQQIYISANTTRDSAWSLLYNVRVEMPRENVTLSNIRLPALRPVHMQLTGKQQLEHVLTRGENQHYCVLGQKAVRTYDNVTFGLDVKTGCEYVLTRDQSQGTPDFTVTFQVVKPETFAKKIRVQLQNTLIELEPFTTHERFFQVVINGTQHQITFEKPVVFTYGAGKRVYINAFETADRHHNSIVHVYTESKELRVLFDGHSAMTIVADKYKGNTNGVCGNNDNEQTHEFVGPNGTEYEHANEFIASYGIGQTCKVPVENTKEKVMEILKEELKQIREQEHKKWARLQEQMKLGFDGQSQHWKELMEDEFLQPQMVLMTQQDQQYSTYEQQEDRQVPRTAVTLENGLVCFSINPIAACKPGYHKEGILRTERVEFVCLERNNQVATQAMQEIRKGNLVDISVLESQQKGRIVSMVNIPKCERHV